MGVAPTSAMNRRSESLFDVQRVKRPLGERGLSAAEGPLSGTGAEVQGAAERPIAAAITAATAAASARLMPLKKKVVLGVVGALVATMAAAFVGSLAAQRRSRKRFSARLRR